MESQKQVIGNLYENAFKMKSKQDIPIRAIEILAKEVGVKEVYVFENILTFERLLPEVKEFSISKINDAVFNKILGSVKSINFIKSYLIDNTDFTQTFFVIFF